MNHIDNGKPSVCFVAPSSYPLLSGREDLQHVGGAEVQQVLLARELVARGYAVSFVVHDHGQAEGEEVAGIRVYKCYRPHAGLRGVRFFYPRLTGLWRALARADADVYYQRGACSETGLVANWCQRHSRAMMFAVANDTNCLPAMPLLRRRYERLLYRYGLFHAEVIVVQTVHQQCVLEYGFGLGSRVVCNCCAQLHQDAGSVPHDGSDRSCVLWVGRLSAEKRPDLVLLLAQELAQYRFLVVGHCNTGSPYGRNLAARLQELPNIEWLGYIPHAQMTQCYRRARVLLSTSESEGFPNVFLEAWACGVPVISTLDPDQLISRQNLGCVAEDHDSIRRAIESAMREPTVWSECGRRAAEYVKKHHTPEASASALEEVLLECVSPRDIR